ncbi:hypothetical protein mRhiFer1_008709 [Rhinolophus ferrumequinum]|uniref:Uncharacterized protein n=1 Tax=Rhinolophus ferrumequinum TaxID=59479 RepID=A0A7J7TR21_RHIFE|nr:hypothetical protein mRhiFer1_008709 [Rhinolophus ferrumequinum]
MKSEVHYHHSPPEAGLPGPGSRCSHSLSRAADVLGPVGLAGKPAESRLGGRTLGSRSQTRFPPSRFWSGSKADVGKIKPVPRTGHRAQGLPPSPAGERAEVPGSYLPPASRLRDQPPLFRAGEAVRDGNTHLQPSQADWDEGRAGNQHAPSPQRNPAAPQSRPPRWLG